MMLYVIIYLIKVNSLFQMFASYDENEIGALDCDEIEGEVDLESEILKQCADEFEKERAMVNYTCYAILYLLLD